MVRPDGMGLPSNFEPPHKAVVIVSSEIKHNGVEANALLMQAVACCPPLGPSLQLASHPFWWEASAETCQECSSSVHPIPSSVLAALVAKCCVIERKEGLGWGN